MSTFSIEPSLLRSHLILRFLAGVFCILMAAQSCRAESDLRIKVDSAFAAGEYEHVELLVLRAERHIDSLSTEDQVQVNLTAGYSMIMLGRESEARDYFQRALDADPTTRLDPVRISPKFRVVFDEVKSSYHSPEQEPHQSDDSPLVLDGPRARSILCNFAMPGVGQWLEGSRTRGTVIFAIEAVAVGTFVWRMDRLRLSRNAYISESNRSKVAAAYDRFFDDYRLAWVAGIAAGALYLAAQADLALMRHKISRDSYSSIEIGWRAEKKPLSLAIAVHW